MRTQTALVVLSFVLGLAGCNPNTHTPDPQPMPPSPLEERLVFERAIGSPFGELIVNDQPTVLTFDLALRSGRAEVRFLAAHLEAIPAQNVALRFALVEDTGIITAAVYYEMHNTVRRRCNAKKPAPAGFLFFEHIVHPRAPRQRTTNATTGHRRTNERIAWR